MNNLYTVLKIDSDIVYLGKQDGSMILINNSFFDFIPLIGDEVEVYHNAGNYFIKKLPLSKELYKSNEYDDSPTLGYKIGGWICVVISIFFFPIIFGTVGLILGYVLRSKGEREHGTIMMISSIGTASIGVIFGAIVGSIIFS